MMGSFASPLGIPLRDDGSPNWISYINVAGNYELMTYTNVANPIKISAPRSLVATATVTVRKYVSFSPFTSWTLLDETIYTNGQTLENLIEDNQLIANSTIYYTTTGEFYIYVGRNGMVGSFSFNNVESGSFNLVCKSVNRSLLPAVKTRRMELPGMSGVYDLDINGVDYEYELRTITMKIQYKGSSYEELRTRARLIAAWLSTPTWCKLILNDEPDKYYLAKVTSQIDLESLWESGSADVEFDCQPFAYRTTEEVLSYALASSFDKTFVNLGTRGINYKSPPGSKSQISISGSWTDMSMTLNGVTIGYPEAGTGTLLIDNVDMEVHLGSTNKLDVITGAIDTFFKIIPGSNNFTLTGTAVSVTVTITYIPLWL
jgi:predicted phage tail component-like protein